MSGTSPKPSKEDVVKDEIIFFIWLNNCKKEKIQEEASQAEEIQSMSLETFKQSQEKSQDGQPKPTPVPIVAACSGTCANEKI